MTVDEISSQTSVLKENIFPERNSMAIETNTKDVKIVQIEKDQVVPTPVPTVALRVTSQINEISSVGILGILGIVAGVAFCILIGVYVSFWRCRGKRAQIHPKISPISSEIKMKLEIFKETEKGETWSHSILKTLGISIEDLENRKIDSISFLWDDFAKELVPR
jgi:hypothetical protein